MVHYKRKGSLKVLKLIKQFIKFGLVGIINTAISLSIYYIFLWLNADLYLLGNVVGFIISTLNAYLWNRKFVFGDKTMQKEERSNASNQSRLTVTKEILKTYATYGFSLGLSTLLLYLEVEIIGIPETVSPLINLFITTPLNFLINKFWVYHNKKNIVD